MTTQGKTKERENEASKNNIIKANISASLGI